MFEKCVDNGVDVLLRNLREEVYEVGVGSESGRFEEASVRFANCLPVIARWAHLAVNGMPNELVEVRTRILSGCG